MNGTCPFCGVTLRVHHKKCERCQRRLSAGSLPGRLELRTGVLTRVRQATPGREGVVLGAVLWLLLLGAFVYHLLLFFSGSSTFMSPVSSFAQHRILSGAKRQQLQSRQADQHPASKPLKLARRGG